jgi:hypothetical protein
VAKAYLDRVGGTATRAVLAALLACAGCGPRDGLSDYERMKQGQQSAADTLTGQGAKIKQVDYAQGSAWTVDLSGLTITDDLLKQVKQLGRITELNLSKSTVTDDQLGLIDQLGLDPLLLKLDLSGTGVTDAGFEKLHNLALLSELNLAGTKVTPAAVERFKKNRQTDPKVPAMFRNPKIRTS